MNKITMNAQWMDTPSDSAATVSPTTVCPSCGSTTLSDDDESSVEFSTYARRVVADMYAALGIPIEVAIRDLAFRPHTFDPNNHVGRHFHEPSRRAR